MWPNDADGNAFRSSLGPLLEKAGYKIVDPGAYQDGQTDYTSLISVYKKNNCQIFHCAPIPPDFTTLWKQAAQQGYAKMCKIAQLAKTGLFPSQIAALGKLGPYLASGAYWTPHFPYKSPLTGLSSKQIGDGYTKTTGRQWNQQLGASMSLFDVARGGAEEGRRPEGQERRSPAAFKHLNVDDAVRPAPLGHRRRAQPRAERRHDADHRRPVGAEPKGSKFPLDFVLCEHSDDPHVPIQARLKPLPVGR